MPQPRISRRASKTWDRLRQWYGARMAEQYGDVPPPDWCDVIDRTDDERLDVALSAVRHVTPVHPPTLGQLEAAIPKRTQFGSQSAASQLCEAALKRFGPQLCVHQIRVPWNYFGPADGPSVSGVQIPACPDCGKPSHRLKLDDLIGQGVAA